MNRILVIHRTKIVVLVVVHVQNIVELVDIIYDRHREIVHKVKTKLVLQIKLMYRRKSKDFDENSPMLNCH